MNHCYLSTPIGEILIVGDRNGLREISLQNGSQPAPPPEGSTEDASALADAAQQLEEYFAGERTHFDLKLNSLGTPFQKRVWGELQKIPFGKTISYGELARRIGQPTASRAVGAANGKNPLAIVVPCHRVIGASGKLVGYGGGMHNKESLLELESNSGAAVGAS